MRFVRVWCKHAWRPANQHCTCIYELLNICLSSVGPCVSSAAVISYADPLIYRNHNGKSRDAGGSTVFITVTICFVFTHCYSCTVYL